MKIKQIQVHCCRLPLTPIERGGIAPYQLSYRLATHADRYFVELQTDDGLTGWGEGELTMAPETIRSFYQYNVTNSLIGLDPRALSQVCSIFKQTTFKKYLNEQVFLAPVEMACWDLLGKSVNLPVHAILGGRIRDRLPCAFPIGVLPHEQLLGLSENASKLGFRTIKLKGEQDFQRDARRLHMLAKALPEVQFRLDPNQAWCVPDCVRFIEQVRGLNIEYLEQPVRVQSLQEMARLRQRSPIPIALNDDCYGPWTLDAIVRTGAADVGIVDLEPLGGISGLVRIAHFAETANLPLTHHTGFDYGVKTAAVAHVVSAMPAFRFPLDCTYQSQDDDVISPRLQIKDGDLIVPDGIGLGIEVVTDKLKEYSI